MSNSNYTLITYGKLPFEYRLALVAFKMGGDFQERALVEVCEELSAACRDDQFWIGDCPVEEMIDRVMQEPDIREQFSTWKAYQAWYLDRETVPTYNRTNPWPVILSPFAHEALLDGYHRLHAYIRDGFTHIPTIAFIDNVSE